MRVIFIPVADRPECARALQVAFKLGQQLDANICGCHIRPHSRSDVSLPSTLGSFEDYDGSWENAWKGKKAKKSTTRPECCLRRLQNVNTTSLSKNPG